MPRPLLFALFFLAVFLQSGAYGLTFMLPRLFDSFGASEKVVGQMLFATALTTLITVLFSGHLSDLMGRMRTLTLACIAIAAALGLYAITASVGLMLVLASVLLGFGWGLTYSLGHFLYFGILLILYFKLLYFKTLHWLMSKWF